jgi:hypothetical protein
MWCFGDNAVMAYPEHQHSHVYLEGSDVQPHLHWTPTITGIYAGVFTLTSNGWIDAANGSVSEAETVLTLTIANATYTFGTLYTANFSGIIPGIVGGVPRKISSLATITLELALPTKPGGGLIALGGFDGHFLKDGHGSRLITAK